MTHLLWAFIRALGSVAWRRARAGAKRPSWTFGFEVLVEALRLHMRWMAGLPTAALRRAAEQLKGRVAKGISVSHEQIGGVPVTWFTPNEPGDRVLLYLHGGGHVFGSASQDATMASELARVAKMRVAAPDFRLAPEAPYPADVEDVSGVYEHLRQTGHEVALAGLSSGGGLALAVLVHLREAGKPLPLRAVLLSPMVDSTGTSASWSTNASVDWGLPEAVLRWAKMYAAGRDTSDLGISPVNARLDGLPPLLVVAGDAEVLRDDGVRLAERGRAAGVDVTLHVEPDMVHAFMAFGRNDPPTSRTLDVIARFLLR
jgi:monoterpene epsilon-lactone hydrolase